ncbi:mannose-1-phosphate guanyltransferase, partial [bacterium]|nr:mannose-1-phosphate guanyltransferase [bacterium]
CSSLNASRNIVFSNNPGQKIALVGVQDLVVVQSGEHTLIVSRHQLEEVKQLVSELPEAEQ